MEKYCDVTASDFVSRQHCYTRNKLCKLFGPNVQCDWETAGLPCVDFSLAGKRRKEEGPTCTIFMSHAKRHIELGTPVILLENVQDGLVWVKNCAIVVTVVVVFNSNQYSDD